MILGDCCGVAVRVHGGGLRGDVARTPTGPVDWTHRQADEPTDGRSTAIGRFDGRVPGRRLTKPFRRRRRWRRSAHAARGDRNAPCRRPPPQSPRSRTDIRTCASCISYIVSSLWFKVEILHIFVLYEIVLLTFALILIIIIG